MGLGLPLSQGLAHKLGGDIQVESEPGKGSRFVFQMPLVETEPLNAPGEEADLIAAESKRQNLSILVVEDNHFSRIILGDQLKQMGHRVVLAEEGEQALVQYHANAFDLVFLDLRMPGMTGLEVAETIRRSEKTQGRQRTPLVMITAEVTASLLKDADQAGIDYTLTKPVSVEVLKTVINEVFGQAVARRDGGQFVGNQPESGLADGSQPKESVVAGDPSEEERGVDADIQLHPRLMSDFAQTPSRAVHYREMLLRDLIAQLQPLVGALAEGRVDVVSECVHALKSLINQVAAGCFTQTWSQFLAARSANLQSVQQEKALLLTAVCEQALQQAQIQHHVQKQQQGMDSTL
jgi:CheY-like chemotaxis protein